MYISEKLYKKRTNSCWCFMGGKLKTKSRQRRSIKWVKKEKRRKTWVKKSAVTRKACFILAPRTRQTKKCFSRSRFCALAWLVVVHTFLLGVTHGSWWSAKSKLEAKVSTLYLQKKKKTDVCDCEYSLGTYIHCVTNIKSGKKREKRQVKRKKL